MIIDSKFFNGEDSNFKYENKLKELLRKNEKHIISKSTMFDPQYILKPVWRQSLMTI